MANPAIKAELSFDFRDAWVLMVDQSTGFMDVAAQMLLGFGFKKFHRFADLDRYHEHREGLSPDLILIDPSPDRGRAMEFIQAVRKQEVASGLSMLVIVVTSKPSPEVVNVARESGANFVVAKPFSPKVLLDRILWSASAEPTWEAESIPPMRGAAQVLQQ